MTAPSSTLKKILPDDGENLVLSIKGAPSNNSIWGWSFSDDVRVAFWPVREAQVARVQTDKQIYMPGQTGMCMGFVYSVCVICVVCIVHVVCLVGVVCVVCTVCVVCFVDIVCVPCVFLHIILG